MRPSLAIDSADTVLEGTLVMLPHFQIHDPQVRLTLCTSNRCSRLPAFAMSAPPLPGAPFSAVPLEILLLQDPNQRPPPPLCLLSVQFPLGLSASAGPIRHRGARPGL